ncbi:hypothetical protein GF362_03670 [Candidatus Dojkabacteria bacterium]|nr:hypothetical protein [Candidatus Dojkabacteria bacterium]
METGWLYNTCRDCPHSREAGPSSVQCTLNRSPLNCDLLKPRDPRSLISLGPRQELTKRLEAVESILSQLSDQLGTKH